MSGVEGDRAPPEHALGNARAELRRAERAASLAEQHERRAHGAPPGIRPLHIRLAELYRQTERRHQASAAIYRAHAGWLQRLDSHRDQDGSGSAAVLTAVADAAGADSATVALHGTEQTELLVAASDDVAKAAHEIEFTLGEGPAHDSAARGEPVLATGPAIACRWPQYGPAVAGLDVHSVAATPLRSTAAACLGVLTVYRAPSPPDPAHLVAVAAALTSTVLAAYADGTLGDLLHDADQHTVLHQATGMVSARAHCPIPDALALIRAHAFATGRSLATVAHDIVHHGYPAGRSHEP